MEEGKYTSGPVLEIEELLNSMGYQLADYNSRTVNRNLQVHMILYRPEGISMNDCTEVYRTVMPKLEILYDTRDIHLEVSSPGIARIIKSMREMRLYNNRGVSLLVDGNWHGGILKDIGSEIVLDTKDGIVKFGIQDIQKAKLDYTQEAVE